MMFGEGAIDAEATQQSFCVWIHFKIAFYNLVYKWNNNVYL